MLIVRRVPRGGVHASAALTTAESVTALVLAHTAAGGELPGLGWLVPAAAAAYGASALVLSRRASIRLVLPTLVLVQLFLHGWLVTLAADGHAAHAGPMLGMTGAMLAAHVAAGVVTATAWLVRRRAVDLAVAWLDPAALPVPSLRSAFVGPVPDRPRRWSTWIVAPTRGPPPVPAAA